MQKMFTEAREERGARSPGLVPIPSFVLSVAGWHGSWSDPRHSRGTCARHRTSCAHRSQICARGRKTCAQAPRTCARTFQLCAHRSEICANAPGICARHSEIGARSSEICAHASRTCAHRSEICAHASRTCAHRSEVCAHASGTCARRSKTCARASRICARGSGIRPRLRLSRCLCLGYPMPCPATGPGAPRPAARSIFSGRRTGDRQRRTENRELSRTHAIERQISLVRAGSGRERGNCTAVIAARKQNSTADKWNTALSLKPLPEQSSAFRLVHAAGLEVSQQSSSRIRH